MSCVFCNSFFHLSQNCENYASDESRKNRIQSNKLCEECLTKECFSKTPKTIFTDCNFDVKCCICYSKKHNSVFCPDKITAPNFFIPNIDQDLFRRFLALLDPIEKQFLAFQSPTILNLCKLQRLTFANTLFVDSLESMPRNGTRIIIACKKAISEDFLKLSHHSYQQPKSQLVTLKNCTVFTEDLKFSNVEIDLNVISSLLSTKTKILKLSKVRITKRVTLDNMFKKAPNLEEFEYEFDRMHGDNANVRLNANFFKYKYGKNFKYLKITVEHDFQIKKLIPFLKKSTSDITLELYVNVPYHERDDRDLFVANLSKYFVLSFSSDSPSISVYVEQWKQWENSYGFVGSFILK